MTASRSPIAFLLPHFRPSGGVKTYLAIAVELTRRGYPVVLAACDLDGAMRETVPPEIEIVPLPASTSWSARLAPVRAQPRRALAFLLPVTLERALHPTLLHVDALAAFLASRRPRAIYTGGAHENAAAWLAKRLSGAPTRLVFTEHNTLTREHPYGRGRHLLSLPPMARLTYADADAIVAVSTDLADHVAKHSGIPRASIAVIHNPAIPRDLNLRAAEPLDHPWFAPAAPPVILGAGRLTRAKDFPTLVKAFALVRRQREVRLIILGAAKTEKKTKKQQALLAALAHDLGVADDVMLPGYAANPTPTWPAPASTSCHRARKVSATCWSKRWRVAVPASPQTARAVHGRFSTTGGTADWCRWGTRPRWRRPSRGRWTPPVIRANSRWRPSDSRSVALSTPTKHCWPPSPGPSSGQSSEFSDCQNAARPGPCGHGKAPRVPLRGGARAAGGVRVGG